MEYTLEKGQKVYLNDTLTFDDGVYEVQNLTNKALKINDVWLPLSQINITGVRNCNVWMETHGNAKRAGYYTAQDLLEIRINEWFDTKLHKQKPKGYAF